MKETVCKANNENRQETDSSYKTYPGDTKQTITKARHTWFDYVKIKTVKYLSLNI